MSTSSSGGTAPALALGIRHVLVFVDDPLWRLHVVGILRGGLSGVRTSCVDTGSDVLAVLAREHVDLMITDVTIPIPTRDGCESLLELACDRMRVPLLVIDGPDPPAAEARALASGAVEFCGRPLDPQPFIERVQALLRDGPRSTLLEVVSLSGLARIIDIERSSCALCVTTAGADGLLLFVAGDLVDARQGLLTGMLAALEIFGWTEPSVTVDFTARAYTRTIHRGLAEVLRRSERAALRAGPAACDEFLERPPEYCSGEPAPALEHLESPDDEATDESIDDAIDDVAAPSAAARPDEASTAPLSPDRPTSAPDARVDRLLADVMRIDGALGAAVLDWRADRCLGVAVGDGRLDVASEARKNRGFLGATLATLDALGLTCPLQDIVITLDDRAHLFHPFGGDRRLFVYVAIDTTTCSFALTRHRLGRLVPAMDI